MFHSAKSASFVLMMGLMTPFIAAGQEDPKVDPAAQDRIDLNVILDEDVSEVINLFGQGEKGPPRFLEYTAKIHDALWTNLGLKLSNLDEALRAQLEIPFKQGVVVVALKEGSPAERSGLKGNDILLNLGDQRAEAVAQARKILLGLGKEPLDVKLIREGKPIQLSLIGPERISKEESGEYWIGVPVSPVDATLRAHLSTLPADSGLVVNDVVKGSPADQVSVKKYDILVELGGKSLKDSESLVKQVQESQGKPIPLKLLRAGKEITVTITPQKRAHQATINLDKSMAQRTYRVVRPNYAAIEVNTRPGGPADEARAQAGKDGEKPGSRQQTTRTEDPSGKKPPTIARYPDVNYTTNGTAASPTDRIEAQLKEVVAKLEEITKALEGIKKTPEK